jgi:hypothetical protein
MFNLSSLFAGGASSASQPLIQALLAKHGGGGLPALPTVDGPPKVGPTVGPPDLTDASARTSNVLDGLNLVTDKLPEAPGIPDGMDGIKSSLAANAAKPRGFLDRIGDFLHSDEGRAQAMRFAAGAFKGGMGGGLEAATNFADQRHHESAAAAAAAADRDERGREFDENHQFHLGQLDATRDQNRETAEHNRRGDMNDSRRIDADLYKHDTPSGDERTRSQTSIYTHLNPSGDTRLSTSERRFEHLTPSGDTETTQAAETARNAATNQTAITTANINHKAPQDSIHVRYQTTPENFGRDHAAHVAAVRPSQVQPTSGAPTKVSSDEDYNALPSGARFIGPDGQVRVKP